MPTFFITSRASLLLDLIVLALVLIVPILLYSVAIVRWSSRVTQHRQLQTILAIVLGLALLAFEADMRWNGWRHLAEPSPFYGTFVFPALWIHLSFAVPTFGLWTVTIISALRGKIDQSASDKRKLHKKLGRLSVLTLIATTLTGWIFYWLAFVAS